ncbi:MAG: squalene synthase HpnC [Planctomycetaceae bacterium]
MTFVLNDLDVWGPDTAGRSAASITDAELYCRRLAESHYENFPVASRLLPRALRQHFCNVYAYCRWADDLGDEIGDPQRSLALLAWWREQLEHCYQHEARHPVFVALRRTITEFDIPQQPFEDLISAFEQDQTVHEYETFDQLRDYCRRSADPVGRIVLSLGRASRDQTVCWSDSICTGLQLANLWQDVSRDADVGRVYLPREDRERFGYAAEMLARRETNAPFLRLMQFEVDRTRHLLQSGLPLVDAVRGRMQVDIDLFIRGGLQILREIERIGYRVWDTRPVVNKRQFARLFVSAVLRTGWRRMRLIRGE